MASSNQISIQTKTFILLLCVALIPNVVLAQADKVFPKTTKGFISITNLKDFLERFDKTSFGDLRREPEAKEFFGSFVEEVKKGFQKKSKVTLGLTLDELKDVVDGEVAIGLIQPKENVLAIITLAEFKKVKPIEKALTTIEANLLKKKKVEEKVTKVQIVKEAGFSLTHYEFPDPFGIIGPPQVFIGKTDKYLVSYHGWVLPGTKKVDHVAQVRQLLSATAGKKHESLADRELYKTTMKMVMDGDKYKSYQVKWFIESFGFVDAAKKIWPEQFTNAPIGSFRKVGFDAIKSAGGLGIVSPGNREFHIRGFLYAPPVDSKNRFRQAAKMLDFTADKNRLLDLPVWVDNTSSSYFAMHARVLKAFNASEPLIDELYGEGTMKTVLENFRTNPKLKANFDVRKEFAANIGDRAIVIRDPKFPASLENKRVVFVMDIADEISPTSRKIHAGPKGDTPKEKDDSEDAKKSDAKKPQAKKTDGKAAGAKKGKKLSRRQQVAKVIKGYMTNEDPNEVERINFKVNGTEITIFKKITPKVEPGGEPGELPDLDDLDDLDDLNDFDDPKPAAKAGGAADGAKGDPIIEYYCIAQYKGQVFISPDLKFMKEILTRYGTNTEASLAKMDWFKRTNAELDKVRNTTFESLRYVTRLDLPYKAAFQLIKDSKKDLRIEKFLKSIMEEEEEKRLFDLKKLPKDFDTSIGPHLGYMGWSMTTEDNGWMFNGILLRKNDSKSDKGDSPKKVD